MPPPLALLLTILFCAYMLRRLAREAPAADPALWLPVVWIFFNASRSPYQWLDTFGISLGIGSSMEGGTPFDAVYFLILIIAGMRVLIRRGIHFGVVARQNVWLTLFFVYCFLAIFWSDFPVIAFKRWIKVLGHPIIALIILTDEKPVAAFRLVMKRSAILMIPLSVLFIKYYPEYGRGFSVFTGQGYNQGIALNKNELGYGCLVFGLFYIWEIITSRTASVSKTRSADLILNIGFLGVILWLLRTAQSATSLGGFVVGTVIIIGLGFRFVNKRFIGGYVITAVVLGLIALEFGLFNLVLNVLGRDATLTDRTLVWADILALVESPLIGAGFESFWLGHRLEAMHAKWAWRPNGAHNGYLETYINLGAIGLFLLIATLISSFRKITATFPQDFDFARLRMGFFLTIVIYNTTEVTFRAVAFLWTIFHIIAIDARGATIYQAMATSREQPDADASEAFEGAEPHTFPPQIESGIRNG